MDSLERSRKAFRYVRQSMYHVAHPARARTTFCGEDIPPSATTKTNPSSIHTCPKCARSVERHKRCSSCKRMLPKTLRFFAERKTYKTRGTSSLSAKCRRCRNIDHANYRSGNKEALSRYGKKYRHTPQYIYSVIGSRRHPVLIAKQKFIDWYNSQDKFCAYCDLKEEFIALIPDGSTSRFARLTIDRLDSSRDYEEGNLALACWRCNGIKGDFLTPEEMRTIAQQFIKPKFAARFPDAYANR
jgi:hypothetical protein